MEARNDRGHGWQAVAPMNQEASEMRRQDSTAQAVIPPVPAEVVPLIPDETPPTPPAKPLNPDSKRAAILRAFLEVGERGMNCFTAALKYGDFVLRTTVSECSRYHGIAFNKKFEQVPGRNGSKVDCVRYSLTAEGAQKARELLGESLKAAV